MTRSPFGLDISASLPLTASQWDAAVLAFLELRRDPFELIGEAIDLDERFVMGPLLRATYAVLGGAPLTAESLVADIALIKSRLAAATPAERSHVEALSQLVCHNFTAAAQLWDQIAAANPRDILAIRIAHDIYLHVGDSAGRLLSLQQVQNAFDRDETTGGLVTGMLAFAYEEIGRYGEAEMLGQHALTQNPADIWAVHALAHTYEMQTRTDSMLDLLAPNGRWTTHSLLANHLWWHLGIRLAAERRLDEALAIADIIEFDQTTAFSMCDYTSLLWRVEFQGGDVGNRWDRVVELWPATAARHTNAFLDLHAMLAFVATRSPHAAEWLSTLSKRVVESAPAPDWSENDEIFACVAQPLVVAISQIRSDSRAAAVTAIDGLSPSLHRIGGSVAQRDVVPLSARGVTFGGPQ